MDDGPVMTREIIETNYARPRRTDWEYDDSLACGDEGADKGRVRHYTGRRECRPDPTSTVGVHSTQEELSS
jgi:hypothetical protein